MIVYILLLALEILSLAVGIFIGYRRGVIKATVRFAEIAVAAVVSFFLSKYIASVIGSWSMDIISALLDSSARELIFSSENSAELIASLFGALMAPVLFMSVFLLIKSLSYIGFNAIMNKFVKKEQSKASAFAGAGIGVLTSIVVCAVVFSPVCCGLYMINSIPQSEKNEMLAVIEKDDDGILHKIANEVPENMPAGEIIMVPSKLITRTSAADIDYCAIEEIPEMVSMVNDLVTSYNFATNEEQDNIRALECAVSSLIPHMEKSDFVSELAVSFVNSIGRSIKNGNSALINLDDSIGDMSETIGDILVGISSDNIVDNMKVLFGDQDDEKGKDGILDIALDIFQADDISAMLNEGKAEDIADIIIDMSENVNMTSTMDAIKDIGTQMLSESILTEISEEDKNYYIDVITTNVNEFIESTKEEGGDLRKNTEIAEDIIKNFDSEIMLEEGEVKLLAVFVAQSFCKEEYYASTEGVTADDIKAFLGID